ncbi:MAG: SDR family oxidoreductase [Acetobacteraceae bacterium]|nr:SDR family oxidoreductase [Acetobacteraceae bacterium]
MAMLSGKVAVVTGGSSGIGAASVARFMAEGARVASLDRAAPAAAREGVLEIAADVADAASVADAFARIEAELGGADILVNSAGIAKLVPLAETGVELLDAILAVNVRGTMLCVQAALPQMRARGGGRIVNVGSVSGRRGNKLRTAYGASKGAIVTMTQVMAVELAEHDILVNAIAPGPVETPLTSGIHFASYRKAWSARVPLGRYGRPEEIAGAILFLAGPDASYITGHILDVDGGFLAGGLLAGDGEGG